MRAARAPLVAAPTAPNDKVYDDRPPQVLHPAQHAAVDFLLGLRVRHRPHAFQIVEPLFRSEQLRLDEQQPREE